jgi:hypothetical protein
MKIKLSKIRELTTKDFINNSSYDYEFNNHSLKTIAEFYDISNEDKQLLFQLDKEFKEITKCMIEKKINLQNYSVEIEKLTELANSNKNIIVEMNHNKEFVVSLEAELNIVYQTDKQLLSKIKKSEPQKLFALYAIEWEESERGWGVRPDGYSFHRTAEEAEEFIKDYQRKLPKEVQDEYSRPCSNKAKLIEVSEGLYNYVTQKGSVWLVPNNEKAYKTYDASHLFGNKNKLK